GRRLRVDPDQVSPLEDRDAGPDTEARQRQLSRRQLLRAGFALPPLVLPFVAACGGGHNNARDLGHSNPTLTNHPVSNTVGPRWPRGSGQTVTFAFAGDVHFPNQWDTEGGAGYTGAPVLADRVKADPTNVLAPIRPVLAGADLAMVNLETAITARGEP